MADEVSKGLTHIQKDILILLLIAFIVVGLTLLIAWIVWKKCCGADLKRAREEREQVFNEDWPTVRSNSFDGTSHIFRRTSAPAAAGTVTMSTSDPGFWRHGPEPSAPALESFRGPSTVATTSLGTMSSTFDPSLASDSSRLPSYETIMRNEDRQ